jgi:hypothetical protein
MSGFAAGFFGQLNNDITDQKQYIRARVDEDRLYLREQGLKRQGTIQEQRGQYEQAARSLITRGADERRVLATLEMDPQGLMEVFRRTDNNNDITGNNLNDMMSIAEDYQGEASMDEVLNSILPMAQAMPNDTDPVTSRRRSIASWLGLDVDEAMTNQVYNEQIVGGMTGDQIMASMNLPVQAEGSNVGGVNFDFSALGSAGDPMSASDVRTHLMTANEDYNLAGMIESLKAQKTGSDEEGAAIPTEDEIAALDVQIKALEEADSLNGVLRLNAILELGIPAGPNTRMLADRFGDTLFDPMYGFTAPSLVTLFGNTEEGTPAGDPANPDVALGNPDTSVVLPQNGVYDPANPAAPTELAPASGTRPRAAGTVDVTEDTPAIPVTSGNADRIIGSYFNDNPNSPGLYVKFEGDRLPTLIRGEDYVEDLDTDMGTEAYKTAIPEYGASQGNRGTRAPVSDFEYVLPSRVGTPGAAVTLTPEASVVNPVADESMAVLEEAVTGIRPRQRPEPTPEVFQMVGNLKTVIEGLNNPEIGASVIEMLGEEDLNVRDRMITGIVALIRTSPDIPEGIEDFLQTLQGLRQTESVNPQTGIGRAPTQPTLMQPSNENSGAPTSIPSATGATRSATPSSPARPGDGVNQSVNSYYDLLVNQDQIRNADQEMLLAALTSNDIDREELNTIAQNFESKYGVEAIRTILNQAQSIR